jgi:hypothetical protein
LRTVFESKEPLTLTEKTYHAIEGGEQTLNRLVQYLKTAARA